MDNPFNFGFYIAFSLLFIVPQCLDAPRRIRNQWFLLSLPVVGIALGFTFVRGAWITVAIGGLYLAIRRYRAAFMFAPLVIVFVLMLPGNFLESASTSSSLVDRQQGWAQNVGKATSKPLGHGIGATGGSGFKAAKVEGVDKTTVVYEPDNQYFKAFYEIGVFGLWTLVLLLISLVLAGREAERRTSGALQTFSLSFTAWLVGSIVSAVVSTWFEIFPNDLYLWLTFGILMTVLRTPIDAPTSRRNGRQLAPPLIAV